MRHRELEGQKTKYNFTHAFGNYFVQETSVYRLSDHNYTYRKLFTYPTVEEAVLAAIFFWKRWTK